MSWLSAVILASCSSLLQSKPITPTSAPDEGDIFSEEGSYIHHATNGLHSDEELDLFTGISLRRCTITRNEQ